TVQRGDVQVTVEDLNFSRRGDEVCGDLTWAFTAQEDLDRLVGLTAQYEVLEVQNDVGDVFFHPLDRAELMQDALGSHAGSRGAGVRSAVISPGPAPPGKFSTGSSASQRSTRFLRFRMTSVTSSFTPSIELNSCRTPSMRTLVTPAPGIEDNSVRRRLLPRVYP